MRARFVVLATALLLVASVPSGAQAAPTENPCEGKEAKQLLCPNLRMGPATELYVEDQGPGRVLLRATSDVRSRGRGPMELIGKRNGWRTMRTNQRIYKAGGGHITVQSDATLRFTDVGAYWGGAYWKVHQLAQFDLRKVEPDGSLGAVVRTSPKLNYCLRDLTRTQPSAVSPPARHYPGCNQNPYRGRVTLGTSVGWSDIYPAPYHQQWINVAGLSGCYSFEMTVDPEENLFESNEGDNSSQRRVLLPFTGITSC
ncbi:MAG TPA: lysyl oxidase family protein [Solirubrobacterales bacterium]|nr:lysyl oxidase family protein [Solirubrobacterales bacterium]